MPFNIGPGELILILIIGLVVLGPGKLPDVASSLGKSVREFRKAATDVTEAGKLDAPAPAPAATAAPPTMVDTLPTTVDAAPPLPATPPVAVPPAVPVATAPSAAGEPSSDPNQS